MARIPTAVSQQPQIQQPGLGAPGQEFRGGVVDTSPIARGIEAIGEGLGAIDIATQRQQNRADEFETKKRFLEFQTQQTLKMRELQQQAEPGAFGFTQQATEEYQKAARDFFGKVPPQLRDAYDLQLADLETKVLLNSDSFENEARTNYYTTSIDTGLSGLRERVIAGEADFDEALLEGRELIAASGLSPTEKKRLDDGWRKDAAAALWRSEYERDPAAALVAVGGGTPAQRMAYQNNRLFSAMVTQESGGNPNAVSPVGATGLMQVMPGTARDIAKQIKDGSFPTNGSDVEVREYLKNPAVNVQYGEYYMNKQLDAFGGDIEAALIAYNAGPKNAKKWLESGRDYSVLPKRSETEPYVRNILTNIGGRAVDRHEFGVNEVGAGEFRSQFYNWSDLRNERFRDAKMDQGAVNALDQVTAAFGHGPLRITSGFRSTDHNQKVSFTKDSRHSHGDAFDIDVSGYSDEEKQRLVSMFIGAGARGIGHYDNGSIHVDFRQGKGKGPGGLALWYNKNRNYQEGEAWFSEGVNQGLSAGGMTFSRSGPADPRFEILDFESRQKLISEAQRRIGDLTKSASNAAVDDLQLRIEQNPLGITEADILSNRNLDGGQKASLLSKLETAVGAVGTQRSEAIRLDLARNPTGVSEADIVDDPLLDDGQKASLLNTRKAAVKEFNEGQGAIALYQQGIKGNSLSTDDRKSVDAAWKQVGLDRENENFGAGALSFVSKRGILPGPVLDDVRGAILQGNLEQSVAMLDVASAANDLDPQSLAGRSGSADVRNAVAEYNYFRKLGYGPEAAAQKVINARQPGVEQENIPKEVQKKIDGISAGDLENLYDESFTDLFTADPTLGPAVSERTILGEYRDILAEEYRQTGDMDTARARADEQMKRVYNVSNATGKPVIMRYPIESYYPSFNGGHEYITTQLNEDVSQAFGPNTQNVDLVPVPGITDVDVRLGRQPRYGVVIEKEDGTLDVLPAGVFFQPDVPKGEAMSAEQRANEIKERIRGTQEKALDNEGLVVNGNELLIRVRPDTFGGGEFENQVVNTTTREIYEYDADTENYEPTGKMYKTPVLVQTDGRTFSFVREPGYLANVQAERDAQAQAIRPVDDPLFELGGQ